MDRKTCFKDQRLNIEWTEQEKSLYTHIIQFIYLYDDKKLAHVSVNTSIYDRGFYYSASVRMDKWHERKTKSRVRMLRFETFLKRGDFRRRYSLSFFFYMNNINYSDSESRINNNILSFFVFYFIICFFPSSFFSIAYLN